MYKEGYYSCLAPTKCPPLLGLADVDGIDSNWPMDVNQDSVRTPGFAENFFTESGELEETIELLAKDFAYYLSLNPKRVDSIFSDRRNLKLVYVLFPTFYSNLTCAVFIQDDGRFVSIAESETLSLKRVNLIQTDLTEAIARIFMSVRTPLDYEKKVDTNPIIISVVQSHEGLEKKIDKMDYTLTSFDPTVHSKLDKIGEYYILPTSTYVLADRDSNEYAFYKALKKNLETLQDSHKDKDQLVYASLKDPRYVNIMFDFILLIDENYFKKIKRIENGMVPIEDE